MAKRPADCTGKPGLKPPHVLLFFLLVLGGSLFVEAAGFLNFRPLLPSLRDEDVGLLPGLPQLDRQVLALAVLFVAGLVRAVAVGAFCVAAGLRTFIVQLVFAMHLMSPMGLPLGLSAKPLGFRSPRVVLTIAAPATVERPESSDRREGGQRGLPQGHDGVHAERSRDDLGLLVLPKPHLLEVQVGLPALGQSSADFLGSRKLTVEPCVVVHLSPPLACAPGGIRSHP